MSWLLPLLVAAVTPAPPAELVQEREMAAQLAGREQTLLNKLADAEREVDLEARALKAAQTRLRASSARLAAAEKKATVAESGLRAATEEAAPRLLARYKLGREGYVRFLLGASSVPDLIKRRRLYDAVLEADLAALERLRSVALARRAARDELAQIRDEQAGAVEAEAGKRAALEERSSGGCSPRCRRTGRSTRRRCARWRTRPAIWAARWGACRSPPLRSRARWRRRWKSR